MQDLGLPEDPELCRKMLGWLARRFKERRGVTLAEGRRPQPPKAERAALAMVKGLADAIRGCPDSANKMALSQRLPVQLLLEAVCTPEVIMHFLVYTLFVYTHVAR